MIMMMTMVMMATVMMLIIMTAINMMMPNDYNPGENMGPTSPPLVPVVVESLALFSLIFEDPS